VTVVRERPLPYLEVAGIEVADSGLAGAAQDFDFGF